MTGDENHHRQQAFNSLSGHSSQQPTSVTPQANEGNSRNDTTQAHGTEGNRSQDSTIDLDTYYQPPMGSRNPPSYRQSRITDPESQYSQEDMPEHNGFSTTFTFWERLNGKGKKRIGWLSSVKEVATFTWLNVLLVFVPIAWAVHQLRLDQHVAIFTLCLLAIIPLSKLLDHCGEQLALYCGKAVGDLIVITLNNAVETATAIVLIVKCELKLLQSTIVGVVLLRLLLVPGASFLTGGARLLTQELHPHVSQLNHSLLTVGALTLLLPTSFYGALKHDTLPGASLNVVSDLSRGNFLKISRALSIFLLIIYVCSRFYFHGPPGARKGLHNHDAPESLKAIVEEMEREDPVINPWVCIISLVIAAVLLGFTTEFLVQNVKHLRHKFGIEELWFGLFVLPMASYAADGILSVAYFIRSRLAERGYVGAPSLTCRLAQGLSIDLGIQFLLFWMPLLVLIGWFTHKPMSLLFDTFEVVVLIGACFLVNYVTADAKTNWAEGIMMITFYFMICITAWFYPGQPDALHMATCDTVQSALMAHSLRFAPPTP